MVSAVSFCEGLTIDVVFSALLRLMACQGLLNLQIKGEVISLMAFAGGIEYQNFECGCLIGSTPARCRIVLPFLYLAHRLTSMLPLLVTIY